MKYILIISLIVLCGCNFNKKVRQYTKDHPGVTCVPVDYNCKGGFYRSGYWIESECEFGYQCSDGVFVKDTQ